MFRWLHGEGVGIGEIRFEADGVQHRPLGFQSPGNVFSIVLCAEERNGKLVPRDAIASAQVRKTEVENDMERSNDCWLILE